MGLFLDRAAFAEGKQKGRRHKHHKAAYPVLSLIEDALSAQKKL
jgi:hypothetical protein